MNIAISDRIRLLCKEMRIPLKELAAGIGISQTGLQGILKNNSTSIDKLVLIANFLKVPVGSFFEDEKKNGTSEVNNYSNNNIGNNSTVTINSLTEIKHKYELQKKEIEGLKKELGSKEKIISLLENLLEQSQNIHNKEK